MTSPAPEVQAPAATPATEAAAPIAPVTPVIPPATPATAPVASTPAAPVVASVVPVVPVGPPEKYEFKLPAGVTIEPAFAERIAATARARGLDNGAGQTLFDAVLAERNAYAPGGAEWVRQNEADKAAVLADPELGAGNPGKLAEVSALAQTVINKWWPDVPDDFLKATGLASKPLFLKGLVRIARASQESTLVLGGQQTGEPKSLAERLYGPDGRGPTSKKTE